MDIHHVCTYFRALNLIVENNLGRRSCIQDNQIEIIICKD